LQRNPCQAEFAQLLHDEVEPATDGAPLQQHFAGLLQVQGQAVELFGDIGFLRQQQQLLLQPLRIELLAHFTQPAEQPGNNRGQTTVFRGFGADGTGKSRRPRKPVEQPVEPQFNNLILT
jgi:hypothetical protein